MLKSFVFLLIAAFAQNFLLYDYNPGVNFGLFAAAVLMLLIAANPVVFRNPGAVAAGAGFLFAGAGMGIHPNPILMLLFLGSVVMLAGYLPGSRLSPVVAAFNGGFSAFFTSFGKAIMRAASGNGQRHHVLRLVVLPLVVTVLFYSLYAWANPDFSILRFSWDEGYVFCLCFGLVWMSAFFFPSSLNILTKLDLQQPDVLTPEQEQTDESSLHLEYRQGLILMTCLNVLLALFLAVSTLTLASGTGAATAADLSHRVHDGVIVLIFSILLAMAVVLFFFRGNLNFYKGNSLLKKLTYTWVGLNALLLLFTACENALYVINYGLTFKRIGVYVWLLLCAFGLVTTALKVKEFRSNWYLVRINTWAAYALFLAAAAIPWNGLITYYNLRYARTQDVNYLLSLGSASLPGLLEYGHLDKDQREKVNTMTREFMTNAQKEKWQSWNYTDWKTRQSLSTLSNPVSHDTSFSVNR